MARRPTQETWLPDALDRNQECFRSISLRSSWFVPSGRAEKWNVVSRYLCLVNTNLEVANLTACSVYGISAWNLRLEGEIQKGLVITDVNEPPIQADNLEVAQFIYLLLNNHKIRIVIDTITSKVVLILGRFTPE